MCIITGVSPDRSTQIPRFLEISCVYFPPPLLSVMKRYNENQVVAPSRGRRKSLEPDDEGKLKAIIKQKVLRERTPNKHDVERITQELATQRRVQRGQATIGWGMSPSTMSKYVTINSDVRLHAQTKSERRIFAESDIRNFTSLGAILKAIFGPGYHGEAATALKDFLIFNTECYHCRIEQWWGRV